MYQRSSCSILLLSCLMLQQIQSFQITPRPTSPCLTVQRNHLSSSRRWKHDGTQSGNGRSVVARSQHISRDTRLFMYNLPPGKNNNNGLGDILKGAAGILLVAAFFTSPVGGFIFGIFNSVLLLTILLPALATIGFRAWQYFNTISGSCPSCGAPATVLKTSKDGEATPTQCFNCGAILQANYENTAIDNITGKNSVMDSGFGSQGASIFDLFGVAPPDYSTTSSTTSTTIFEDEPPTRGPKKDKKKGRDDMIIIDAEIEEDDDEKPFQ